MSLNLQQWVKASLFRAMIADGLTKIVPVGFFQDSPEGLEAGEMERIELRINGPSTRRYSSKYDRHDFDVNVLVTGQQTDNIYSFDRLLDKVSNAVKDTYCIQEIDETHQTAPFVVVGTLKIYKSIRYRRNTHNFGLIDKNGQLYQGVVTGKYYIDLPRA